MSIKISNTFTEELKADSIENQQIRQVFEAHFSYVESKKTSNPTLIYWNKSLAEELEIEDSDFTEDEIINTFSGNQKFKNQKAFAMCYGGHQFGHWAGQLGDGRAMTIGEIDTNKKKYFLQLKGAGPTPYSRNADGLAVLRSSIREYLMSEAMFHLGIPTTRALSITKTGDKVLRDMLYDGHPEWEEGAVVCRVSESFIRFGNFEIFASRSDLKNLQLLSDYCINHYYPEVKTEPIPIASFFKKVAEKTLEMIIHWERVGFVHGVMNTDNLSIIGETIDYGPYGFLDAFDKNWTPNTTDLQHKRYRFGNQAQIALWNLVQLANALYKICPESEKFVDILETWKLNYQQEHAKMMAQKIGIGILYDSDYELLIELENLLQGTQVDYTIFFQNLSFASIDNWEPLIKESFYLEDTKALIEQWAPWFKTYFSKIDSEKTSEESRKKMMSLSNPRYILRNYMLQLAIKEAETGKFDIFNELIEAIKNPYNADDRFEKWFALQPEWAKTSVGCGQLSCSS